MSENGVMVASFCLLTSTESDAFTELCISIIQAFFPRSLVDPLVLRAPWQFDAFKIPDLLLTARRRWACRCLAFPCRFWLAPMAYFGETSWPRRTWLVLWWHADSNDTDPNHPSWLCLPLRYVLNYSVMTTSHWFTYCLVTVMPRLLTLWLLVNP